MLLVLPRRAFALEMEYHCYNGFDPIVTAFQKVALIFGANNYQGMFFSMAVAGVLFGGMFVYLKVFMGGRLSLGAWVTPFFLGVILYLGLMVPTGNLTIQDDVLNRFQIVQGVPDGIVAMADVSKLIERSIIEIIDLVGAPNAPNYKESAGGIGNAGIDVTNINEMTSCQNIVTKHISFFTNNGVTPHYLIMQSVLSNMINDAILYADPGTAAKVLANKNQVSTGVGLGLMGSEWLPVARAVVTAVAVGLVPFVVLLIPTPLSGRTMGTPEGIAMEIRETNMDVPVMANALSHGWNSRTVSQGNQLDHGTGGGLGWSSRGNAFATGFGSTAVSAAVQQQKICISWQSTPQRQI